MRYMIIVKATSETEAETIPVAADPQLLAEMADYHEQLMKAGVLLDGSGLKPSLQGWRIRYDGDTRTVIDGPFAETRELIAGYTLIQVKSRAEAMEWARRFPNPAGRGKPAEIEVRPLYELDDFGLSPEVERMKQMALDGGNAA
ncbi:MAG TPA: YciI family protein [Thiobacillus sp.]|nr:YciI family protein [Thiobacillus sp.]